MDWMTAHFALTLDTAPPASPVLLVNGGADRTGSQVVSLALSTPSADVQEMKVWGDIDPTASPTFQVAEIASQWTLWVSEVAVRLSAGAGRKYLYARLRDDVCNQTPAFTDWIDLDTTSPVVSITSPVDLGRISTVSPCDTSIFSWQANQPFTRYEVRVVPSTGSSHQAGVLVPVTGGSVATSADGVFPASTPITTTLKGLDVLAASPGDGTKVCKTFVLGSSGVWSA